MTWLMNFVSTPADGYHMVLGMVRPDADLSSPEVRAWNRRYCHEEAHPHI